MIKPLPNRLLVELLPRHQSKLDIVLVDKKKHYDGLRRGVVRAIGRLVREVSVGDIVYFPGDYGDSFEIDGEGRISDGVQWRRLKQKDILAVEVAA